MRLWRRTRGEVVRWQSFAQGAVWLFGLALLAGSVGTWGLTPAQSDAQPTIMALVVRVIDGDTIEVQGAAGVLQTVRLMGVDTPETKHPTRPVEYYGPEAAAIAHAALAGATVGLTVDPTGDHVDAYGRLLRYVTVVGVDFNAALVRDGYARAVRGFAYSRRAEFVALENAARSRGVGLWGRRGQG